MQVAAGQPAGRQDDRSGRPAASAGRVPGRDRSRRQRAAGRLAAGSAARRRPAAVRGHRRIGGRFAADSRPGAGDRPGLQAQRAAAAALPDRSGGLEQLPAGRQDDSRRAISQRLQRGGRGRGPQRRAAAQEDRRHRAARRATRCWSRRIRRSPISSATRRDFFLVSRLEDSNPPRHERAWIAVAILLAMVAGGDASNGCRCCKAAMLGGAALMLLTRCVIDRHGPAEHRLGSAAGDRRLVCRWARPWKRRAPREQIAERA